MAVIRIGILGASGRMGRLLIREVAAGKGFALSGATEAKGHRAIGQDAGVLAGLFRLGVAVSDDAAALMAASDVVIDFTLPAVTVRHAKLAAKAGTAMVIGTTGFAPAEVKAIAAAARRVPIVQAPNMSLAVNLLFALTKRAAAVLDATYDISISEIHHREKRDAPSGTALALGAAAQAGRKQKGKPAKIPMVSIRAGDAAGEHTVLFAGEGERLELAHKATSRQVFARGAVFAARWVKGKPPRLYDMADVLGLG